MFLFVFKDGNIRQVEENLTVSDVLALKEHLLRIFTNDTVNFVEVIVDNDKICYVPVRNAITLNGKDLTGEFGRIHT